MHEKVHFSLVVRRKISSKSAFLTWLQQDAPRGPERHAGGEVRGRGAGGVSAPQRHQHEVPLHFKTDRRVTNPAEERLPVIAVQSEEEQSKELIENH